MELRSGRSRSNTPLLTNLADQDVIITGNHIEKISKTSTTIKTYGNITSSESKHMKLRSKRAQKGFYKTSDYSSEDGDQETSSPSRHISDNLKNQLREDSFYSSNGDKDISALKIYKEAGEYWNKFPKTDYTYSRHSKDRIELAPGVVAMPNMSRRSLHSYSSVQGGYTLNKQTNTDMYAEADSMEFVSTTNGSSLKHRSLLHSNNNQDEQVEEQFVIRRRLYSERSTVYQRFVQVFITIFTTLFYPLYYVYDKQHSLVLWFARILHKIASRMMLFDTWLLRGSTADKKISIIMGLCLFPLMLFGGWWLICGLSQLLQDTFFNSTITTPQIPPSILPIVSSWLPETAVNPNKESDVIIGENGARELSELRAKIDMMQREFIESARTRDSGMLNVDSTIRDLKIKIDLIQSDLIQSEQSRKDDWAKLLFDLESKRSEDKEAIRIEIKEQRRESLIDIEHYVFKFLKEIFGTPNHVINKQDFTKWIQLIFVAQQDLDTRLTNLTRNLRSEFITILADNEKLLMDKVTSKILELNVELSKSNGGALSSINFSDEHIRKLVMEALAVYDADKTGLVDFALESAGGHVISTRCTESYQVKTAIISIFGIPIYYPNNSPRTAITPGMNPGECWAFQDFPGFLVVKLSARISVEAFSVEHISKRLSATGRIDSALKQFEVYGLVNEKDPDPILLGSYEYRDDGKPLQYFEVQERGHIFDMIELRILSNHGNPNYTCLYRFRVHGTLSHEPT